MIRKTSSTPAPSTAIEIAALPDDLKALAKQLAGGAKATEISTATIQDAYVAASAKNDFGLTYALQTMMKVGMGEPVSAVTEQATSAGPETDEEDAVAKEVQKFGDFLDTRVIGQDEAKDIAKRMYRSMLSVPDGSPISIVKCLGQSGPPGTGKTELAKTIAAYFYGDDTNFVYINVPEEIKSKQDLYVFTGSPPGFLGYESPNSSSPFCAQKIQQMIGDGTKPLIILMDEPDKLTDPQLKNELWNFFGRVLQDGVFKTSDQIETKVPRIMFIIASNAGDASVGGLEGDLAAKHYADALKNSLPTHIADRVRNFVGTRKLTVSQAAQVAKKFIKSAIKDQTNALRTSKGIDVQVNTDQSVYDLLGELAQGSGGARPIKAFVDDLIVPIMAPKLGRASDDEIYQLKVAGSDPLELEKMKRMFVQAGGIPGTYDVDKFPIELPCVNPAPKLKKYNGPVPHALAHMEVMGAGAVGGRGYFLSDVGTETSVNQMYFLKSGATEDKDRFLELVLPPNLADANYELRATSINKDELFFYGVSVEEGKDEPTASCFIYDANAKAFNEVPAPPFEMIDPAIGSVNGKILMAGGRNLRMEDGEWNLSQDIRDNGEVPVANVTMLFDPVSKQWTVLDQVKMNVPRAGATTIEKNGKLWIIGGEKTAQRANDVNFAMTCTDVEVFDPETCSFTMERPLPIPTSYATAIGDDFGGITLLGGRERLDNVPAGSDTIADKGNILRLNVDDPQANWKLRGQLTAPAANVAAIPHANGGYAIGPLYQGPAEFDPNFQMLQ